MDATSGAAAGENRGAGLLGHGRCNGSGARSGSASPRSSSGGDSRRHSASSGDPSGSTRGSNSEDSAVAKSSYQAPSETMIPDAVAKDDWTGMGVVYLPKCNHGHYAKLKKCWGARTPGTACLDAQWSNASSLSGLIRSGQAMMERASNNCGRR